MLAEVLGHALLHSTQRYYRVSEKWARQAVQRLLTHQVDTTGTRTWRQGQAVLDAARTRMRSVRSPSRTGACTEPANVQTGGGACPFRFRCVGCGHFRTDASYLPELQAYYDRLLTEWERVLAANRARCVGAVGGSAQPGRDG